MLGNNAGLYEVFDENNISQIAKVTKDYFAGPDLSENRWLKDNRLPIYILCNTWVLVAHDAGGVIYGNLVRRLIEESSKGDGQGLSDAIGWAALAADAYILNKHSDVQHNHPPLNLPVHRDFWVSLQSLKPQLALQILRFPKRYSATVPREYSVFRDKALASIADTDRYNRREVVPRLQMLFHTQSGLLRQYRMRNGRLTDAYPLSLEEAEGIAVIAQSIVREIVGEFPGFHCPSRKSNCDGSFPRFGSGAARLCGKSIVDRYRWMVLRQEYTPMHAIPDYNVADGDPDLGNSYVDQTDTRTSHSNWHRNWNFAVSQNPCIALLLTVAKNYKCDRLIAKERPDNMSKQLYCKDVLMDRIASSRFSASIALTDQRVNQSWAEIGCLTNCWATIDRSHASDSITKELVQLLFPASWVTAFFSCVPQGYVRSEEDRGPSKLYAFATMGCGCTFAVLSLTCFAIDTAAQVWRFVVDDLDKYGNEFAAIAQASLQPEAAVDLTSCISRLIEDYGPEMVLAKAYGDDGVCLSRLAPFVIKANEFFGFSVNSEKSFLTGRFRESCGTDWLNDGSGPVLVSSVYWPRTRISGNWDKIRKDTTTEWDGSDRCTTSMVTRLIELQRSLYLGGFGQASSFLGDLLRAHIPGLSVTGCDVLTAGSIYDDDEPVSEWCYYVGASDRQIREHQYRGPYVPLAFRTKYGASLPDGYVFDEAYRDWLEYSGDPERPRYCRQVILQYRVTKVVPKLSAAAYRLNYLEECAYEIALRNNGGRAIDGLIHSSGNSLTSRVPVFVNDIVGARPAAIPRSQLLGTEKVGISWVVL